MAGQQILLISGVGPQENQPETARLPFFLALEKEINKAEMDGKSIIIEMDANSKLGPERIPNVKHDISPNGRLLAGVIDRHALYVLNSSDKCEGLITRKRTTINGTEESSIDMVLVSADLVQFVEKLLIDEDRKHSLTKLTRNKHKVESDHNPLITTFSMSWHKCDNREDVEVFNLKNKECQKKFHKETSKNTYLSSAFDDEGDINEQVNTFLKRLNKVQHKCFTKIKVTEQIDKETDELYKEWRRMQSKPNEINKEELKEVEDKLADKIAKNYRTIKTEAGNIDCAEEGGFHTGRLWELKKKLWPRAKDPPTAMLDNEDNLVTSDECIQELSLQKLAVERLREREIKDELKDMKEVKEKRCEDNLKKAKLNKTPDWNLEEVKIVLHNLKTGVSRDPMGLANELFHPNVAGSDLILAIQKLMNKIKRDQVFPARFEICNISSIWKSKGPKNKFESYRGVFRVSVFRNILDILIYNDEYHNIEKNLTDANVGSRKNRNIRDHIFVLNAVINSIIQDNEKAHDFQIYDTKETFDSLWVHEVINDLFDAGFTSDKLNLLFLESASAQVAVKTPSGISRRTTILNKIMQGSVWGGLCCTVLMDKLAKFVYSRPELMIKYKGLVPVPPLEMVDDILTISKCSSQSVQMNSVVNSFMETKNLTLNTKKCHNVHMGKSKQCPKLRIHDEYMQNQEQVKYLGDELVATGTARATIDKRTAKGFGITSDITAITDDIPLGQWRIQAGLLLRQAMLVNGTLFNSECWQGKEVSKDILLLSKPDQALHRSLISAHSKTPLEFLYLEFGTAPFQFIHAGRRAKYQQYILQKETEELIKQVYSAQKVESVPGDFCELVTESLRSLDIHMNEHQIEAMSVKEYKALIKSQVKKSAFKYLLEEQKRHSKVDHIKYEKLEIQPYLCSPLFSRKEQSTLFRLRSRTIPGIRNDFRGMYKDDISCPVCPPNMLLDTIQNLVTCPTIQALMQSRGLDSTNLEYQDIFSNDVAKQHLATVLFTQLSEC